MRNRKELGALFQTIVEQRGEARKMQDFMDTIKDYEVWTEIARQLAELVGWIDHNEERYATLLWGE